MDKKYEFRLSDFKVKMSKNRMDDRLYVKLHGHSKMVTIPYKISLGKIKPFVPYIDVDRERIYESVVKAVEGHASCALCKEHKFMAAEINNSVRKYFNRWLKSKQGEQRIKKRENKIERERAMKIMDTAFREKIGKRRVYEILSDSEMIKIKNTTKQNVLAEFIHDS